jgi:hypothetical protein
MGTFNRTLDELKSKAVLFWPTELKKEAVEESVLPLLIESQDKFLSILKIADAHPEAWISALGTSKLSGNLFLKHVMVLSDLGGEALNKIAPLGKHLRQEKLVYLWQEKEHTYSPTEGLTCKSLTNKALKVDGRSIALKSLPLNAKMKDIAMVLLYASQSLGNELPEDIASKCVLGSLIGKPDELELFVKQAYIRISRQIGGADANSLGQQAQKYVLNQLRKHLPDHWQLQSNGTLPGVSHNNQKTDSTFDIVAKSPNGKRFGVEVSFQFTTNSVIERKAAQAQARQQSVHQAGYLICYVLDGAGNINIRARASSTICDYSDCTVAFSEAEIKHLAQFMIQQGEAS